MVLSPARPTSDQADGLLTGVPSRLPRGRNPAAWSLVTRGRERVVLVDVAELALVLLAPELGPLFLPVLVLRDVLGLWRGVRGRRHLVRVEGVEPGGDPLFLGEPGELLVLFVVDVLRRAPVLAAVPVEPLGEVVLL